MKRNHLFLSTLLATLALAALLGSLVIGEPAKDTKDPKDKPAAPTDFKLPPGWTEADMQACMLASTPGKMQEFLASGAGVWEGKNTMWMYPGSDSMKSEVTVTITPIMDGRYTKSEWKGDMPGMGPFSGLGTSGYDNVSKKFVTTWLDNYSTGIITGTGELSADGKTLTWTLTFNCPITKKPATMRQIEKITGANTRTMEMFSTEPKSGKEYKMMVVEMTKKPAATPKGQ